MRIHAVVAAACLAVCAAAPRASADDEDAPWLTAVQTEADRAMLRGLVETDEAKRKKTHAKWEEERLAATGPGPLAGPRDEMDPAHPQGPFEARKVRITDGLVKAIQIGPPPVRVAACRSLGDMGPAFSHGRAALGKAVDDKDPRVRTAAMRALSRIRMFEGGRRVEDFLGQFVNRLLDEDTQARHAAIDIVAYLLRDDVRYGRLPDLALKHLRTCIRSDDAAIRAAAYVAVARVAPRRAESLATMRIGLDDPVAEVRAAAAGSLMLVAAKRPEEERHEIVARLRALLSDDDFDVRWAAARSAWYVTRDAVGLLPVCQEALGRLADVDLATPCAILCQIGAEAASAAPELVRVLGKVPHVRHMTSGTEPLDALYSVGPDFADVKTAIGKRLKSEDPLDRRAGVWALGAVHAPSEEIVAFVKAHLSEDNDPHVLHAVRDVLAARAPAHAMTKARFRAALGHDDLDARIGIAAGLAPLGAEAAEFVPIIVTLLDDTKTGTWARGRLVDLLVRIGTPEAITALAKRLAEPRFNTHVWEALPRAGTSARPALDAVLKWYDRDPGSAAAVLDAIGPGTADKLQTLLDRLSASRGLAVVHLCEAIRKAGGNASACLDPLERQVSSGDERIRIGACRALGRWGEAASRALPALRRLRDKGRQLDADARAAAVAAYRIGGEPDRDAAVRRVLYDVRHSHPPDVSILDALGAVGPAAAEGVPDLVEAALEWRRAHVKRPARTRAALRALGAMGPAARSALPALRSMARNVLFQADAEAAIRRIEAAAPPEK